MNRDWSVDFLTAVCSGLIVAGFVLIARGPIWAAVGFGLLAHLLTPTRRQGAGR